MSHKSACIAAAFATALMFTVSAQRADAATYDFIAQAGGSDIDWNTKFPIVPHVYTPLGGIGVIASASGNSYSRAYLDSPSGGPGGLGVCSSFSCAGTPDDNVGVIGGVALTGVLEKLTLTFLSSVTITDLYFNNRDHGLFTGWLSINTLLYFVSGGHLAAALIGSVFDFLPLASDNPYGCGIARINCDFYLASLIAGPSPIIGPVPIPAPFLLMGTVLAGTYVVGRWRRRRKQGAAA